MKWVFNLTKHKYESSLTPVRVPQASVDEHTYTYNSIGKLATINQDVLDYELTYGVNEQRIEAIKKEYGQVVYTKQYINSASMETKNGEELTYLYAEGQPFAIHKKTVDDEMMYYLHLDHLGSIMSITDQSGIVVETRSGVYPALGRRNACSGWFRFMQANGAAKTLATTIPSLQNKHREGRPQDPNTWSYQLTPFGALNITDRGYTFHEHLIEFSLINMNGRMYDPVLGRVISPDNYIQAPDNTQSFNRYSYCWNNPLKYTDPSGDIITWNVSRSGASLGINFTPVGIPLGFGVNTGWGDGFSAGVYGEVGYRVGGTGFGSGITLSQSLDYNFKYNSWSTTTAQGAYGSLGPVNSGINFSQTYNMSTKQWDNGWGVSAGVGIGNDESGLGFNVGYGSGGWTYGVGGYYNSKAWENNPAYASDEWNDNGKIQKTNNCYSYALDEKENGNYWGLQPGEVGGKPIRTDADLNLDYVTNAAISDGRIKKPTLLNKLGFGKRGYYSVYLVSADGVDYHWYRQDKGGMWSHKPGITPVINVDASGQSISNPVRANHGIYKNGGTLLWVKRK